MPAVIYYVDLGASGTHFISLFGIVGGAQLCKLKVYLRHEELNVLLYSFGAIMHEREVTLFEFLQRLEYCEATTSLK